jgi:hypothetical protein
LRKCNVDAIVTIIDTYHIIEIQKINSIIQIRKGSLHRPIPNLLFISDINLSDLTCGMVKVKVVHTTFNNISVISWRSILFVMENRTTQIKPLTCRKSLTKYVDAIVTIIDTYHIIEIQKINSIIQIRKGSLHRPVIFMLVYIFIFDISQESNN